MSEHTENTEHPVAPAGARFDPVTGADLSAGADGERRQAFALQPGEPVASFNLVSSLLPLASGAAPQNYRWALALGVLIPVVAGALGFLAFAFVAAAVVVPAVYVVYLYDVNEWEDEPVGVVLLTIGLAAALGVGFTFLWHAGFLGGNASPVSYDGSGSVRWSSLLVLVLLVPVVSEVLKQLGPLFLASRVRFDDLIDGVTFGVASGAAFAAAETIVVNRGLFSGFGQVDSPDAGFWVSLVLSAAVVKPIVYGAATGIAVASFSGLGAGYDGLRPAYVRGLVEALLANIAFQGGLFFAARLEGTTGAVVGLVWGLLVAGVLVLRLRHVLHFAVLEAALESAAEGVTPRDAARGTAYCPSCEMPLLPGAGFCVACGTSVRAGSKTARARNRAEDDQVPAAPVRSRTSVVVVGAVAATVFVAGAVGQASAAATGGDQQSTGAPIELETQVGTGPTTEPPPEPAPVPGPTPSPSAAPSLTSPSLTSSSLTFGAADDGGFGATTSNQVDLGGGLGFEVPDGYEVEAEEGFASVFGDGGYFFALVTPGPTDMETLVTDHLTGLEGIGIQDLAVSEPEPLEVPSSSVVQCVGLGYQGVLATQQGGSLPIEGFAYYFLRQDGSGVTAFGLYPQGALQDGGPLVDGYNLMINSLVGSL